MSEVLLVKRPEDIPVIVRVLHDCWFDKDDIHFDPDGATLTIRFTKAVPEEGQPTVGLKLFREIEVPFFESFLRIHHVRDWIVKDTEQVGFYDFNEVRFDQRKNRIEITTGIPISIVVDVECLELSVEVTKRVATVRAHRRLF